MPTACPPSTRALLDALGISLGELQQRGLRHCDEAGALEIAEIGSDGREHRLAPDAADAWRRMREAARMEGVDLHIVSAFRSIDRQAEIVRAKASRGTPMREILAVSAAPGFSEHHTGRAIDIGTPGVPDLTEAFEASAAFRWLKDNAERFGFLLSYPRNNSQGYAYEPWHWLYERLALVQPSEAWCDSYVAMVQELEARNEPTVPFPLGYDPTDFPALVSRLRDEEKGLGLPAGFVPHSTYWLVREGEVIGASNLRHRLTEGLRRRGGHIGYGIRPSARRRGYGRVLLSRTLLEAKKRGLEKVLLTCDKHNIASAKIIRANGGVLDSEESLGDPPAVVQRYWITL